MLLERFDSADFKESDAGKPLIVTKENARKAFFYKMNRHGSARSAVPRLTQRAGFVRGNSFAGMGFSQRVVVKINPVKNRTRGVGAGAGSGAKNLYAHVHYISRSGAGKEGRKAVLFDKEQDGVDGLAFYQLCQDDRHHFRMIVSPEKGHAIEDFQGYVRSLMAVMEKDLGTALHWVSAVHYDTDDVHAHVIIRGVNEREEDLVIGRDYIAAGIRGRAQELATEILGQRSLEELQASMEKEVDALRVTSLDRFIDKKADAQRVIDVRWENNFGRSAHYEGLIKGRLKVLQAAGLAAEYPPGVYTLKEGYQETLAQISERDDVIKRLYKRFEPGFEGLSIYSVKAGQGQEIEGRVVDRGFMDEVSDREYIVVQDFAKGLHYVPVGGNAGLDDVERGALIRVRPGDQSTGKADYNINLIARQNGGIYDPEQHRAYIEAQMPYLAEEDRPRYLAAHARRLDTLERNGVVQETGGGRYRVPEDVIAQGKAVTQKINEREKKRFYPRIDVLSKEPAAEQVSAPKKTWLDRQLYRQQQGVPVAAFRDAEISAALEGRKDWLIEHNLGFIQSGGAFALRDHALLKLDKLEVHTTGHRLAAKAGLSFNDRQVQEGQVCHYLGSVNLESGVWAVVAGARDLQMVPLDRKPDIERGAEVSFKADGQGRFILQQAERIKDQGRGRTDDDEQERER